MNRLVLIGNGFDLAHGLKTSYADFIHWYKAHRVEMLGEEHSNVSKEPLCTIELKERRPLSVYAMNYILEHSLDFSHEQFFDYIVGNETEFHTTFSTFFNKILQSIETKGWVDIENEYYKSLVGYAFNHSILTDEDKSAHNLNLRIAFIKDLLVQYLQEATKTQVDKISSIEHAMYAPLQEDDMSIAGIKCLKEHKSYWEKQKDDGPIEEKIDKFGWDYGRTMDRIQLWKKSPQCNTYPDAFSLPDDIMFLNFNYTNTVQLYIKPRYQNQENHIHGEITHPEGVIFGYGDEIDVNFKRLQDLNKNIYLQNVKSILYQNSPNYKHMLRFIESAPFQVLIMGHSCGISDRTLLNTIFEHPNCVSIKPYYYIIDAEKHLDNYIELMQNISRNFTNMKLMRDRVVDKTHSEPLKH